MNQIYLEHIFLKTPIRAENKRTHKIKWYTFFCIKRGFRYIFGKCKLHFWRAPLTKCKWKCLQVAFFLDRFPWNNMKYIMDSESKQVGGGAGKCNIEALHTCKLYMFPNTPPTPFLWKQCTTGDPRPKGQGTFKSDVTKIKATSPPPSTLMMIRGGGGVWYK